MAGRGRAGMIGHTQDNGRVADASLPFAVRRLFVDEEDAVAVVDERGAVGEEERLEPGVILGGRRKLRFRRRSVGLIGLVVHDVKVVGPAGFEPASGGL